MKRHFGLKARFTALIAMLLTAIFALIAGVLIQVNAGALRTDLLERSITFAALATSPIGESYLTYQDSGTALITQRINDFARLDKNISNVGVVDLKGNIVYSLNPGMAATSVKAAESFEPDFTYGSNGAIQRIVYPFLEQTGRHKYGVVYEVSSTNIDAAVSNFIRLILLYSFIGLLISTVVTYLLVNRLFLSPIKQMSTQATIIAHGYYSEQMATNRNDEIGDLAHSVNQMAESLKADLRKLQEVDSIKSEFMMIASHNLRTPITIIKGYLELIRNEALSQELSDLVGSIEASNQRLGMFAEDMLIISNIEAGENIFRLEPISFDGLFGDLIPEFESLSKEKGVKFTATIDEIKAGVVGSKLYLRNAIWNFLDNSLKFTEEGGAIDFRIRQVGNNIQLEIKDTGAGISPDEMPKLFTKFHRGTSTQTYNYEGTGIGLYIAKLIIDAHRGDITVNSTLGEGTTFTVTLPIHLAETKA